MSYEIIRREVQAEDERGKHDFKVQRYYITPNGREPQVDGVFEDPFIEVWADGSITVHSRHQSMWMYDDQWRGIINGLQQAMDDKRTQRREKERKWLEETADDKEFMGYEVDLSRNEVIDALTTCKMKIEKRGDAFVYTQPLILFRGAWYELGRTDLTDDVATGRCERYSARAWRLYYKRMAEACYGGRLHEWSDGRLGFSVIDAFSDG